MKCLEMVRKRALHKSNILNVYCETGSTRKPFSIAVFYYLIKANQCLGYSAPAPDLQIYNNAIDA